MQYYDTTLRLSGSTQNEINKTVSAPEFLVLQYIHGVDALVNVTLAPKAKISMSEEKERLKRTYDAALQKREQSIDRIFGALGNLPTELPEEIAERLGFVDEDDIIAVAKNATKTTNRSNQSKALSMVEKQREDSVISANEVEKEMNLLTE